MDSQQIMKFLDAQKDVPRHLRTVITRKHAGRWPMWLARTMRREGGQIIEVAKWSTRMPQPYVVLRWYWSDRHIGIKWNGYATLRQARAQAEQTFSLDAVHVDLRP